MTYSTAPRFECTLQRVPNQTIWEAEITELDSKIVITELFYWRWTARVWIWSTLRRWRRNPSYYRGEKWQE